MQKLFLLCTCLLTGLMSPRADAADVTVHLQLTAGNELEVSYRIPQTCTTLTFLNHETLPQFGKEIRASWQALDDCGSVNRACETRGNVSLGLVSGEKIIVACQTPFKVPTYYAVDMPRLLRKHDL